MTDRWASLDTQSEDDRITKTIKTWRVEPLAWGEARVNSRCSFEPACPYAARALAKLDETLTAAGSDKIHQDSPARAAMAHVFWRDRPLRSGRFHITMHVEDYCGLKLADAFAIANPDR